MSGFIRKYERSDDCDGKQAEENEKRVKRHSKDTGACFGHKRVPYEEIGFLGYLGNGVKAESVDSGSDEVVFLVSKVFHFFSSCFAELSLTCFLLAML